MLAAALPPPPVPLLVGGDLTEIAEFEARGGRYRDARGRLADPFALLKRAGWNFARFRVWNAPKDGYCDVPHTLALAKRAKRAGMRISIDFHYSDTWADPGHQIKPAAWKDLPLDGLAQAVRGFTRDTVAALVRQGTPPYMVQVGNEIRAGMLWPDGKVENDDPAAWKRLGTLVKAGVQGTADGAGKHRVLTMLHLDQGGDNGAFRWWFDHIRAEGATFDTIGLSYYPFWHGPLAGLKANMDDLARRYGKDVYIVETAYPSGWLAPPARTLYNGPKTEPGYPATPGGQAQFLRELRRIVAAVPEGRGRGILYWAPLWLATPGRRTPYANLATFTPEGRAMPAVAALGGG